MIDDLQHYKFTCKKLSKRLKGIGDLLSSESDRGCALWAAALLDEKLEELLKAIFLEDEAEVNILLRGMGPLATFSARIRLIYVLGILQKSDFHKCTIIRKVRNSFAHDSSTLDFESSPISDWVDALATLPIILNESTRREKFTKTVVFLIEAMQDRVDTMKPLVLNNLFSTVIEVEQLQAKEREY